MDHDVEISEILLVRYGADTRDTVRFRMQIILEKPVRKRQSAEGQLTVLP